MIKLIILYTVSLLYSILINAQDVKIGDQVWMSKNLDVSTFRNGDIIKEAKSIEEWTTARSEHLPMWCYYEFNKEYGNTYGKLYNWYAVNDSRGLAPRGYHIPSDSEWSILIKTLGNEEIAGNKLKSKNGWRSFNKTEKVICNNCMNWSDSLKKHDTCRFCLRSFFTLQDKIPIEILSGDGNNISGFNALPGGYLLYNNQNTSSQYSFKYIGSYGKWWTLTDFITIFVWSYGLSFYDTKISRVPTLKYLGHSVRCIKD